MAFAAVFAILILARVPSVLGPDYDANDWGEW